MRHLTNSQNMHYGKSGVVGGKQRGSRGGARRTGRRGDLAGGSIRGRQEVTNEVRGLANIVALSILSRVPDAEDADHAGHLVHPVDDDVGWHGGQLAGVGHPAGPALGGQGGQAVDRGGQGTGNPHRHGLVALSKPGRDMTPVVARRRRPGNPHAASDAAI